MYAQNPYTLSMWDPSRGTGVYRAPPTQYVPCLHHGDDRMMEFDFENSLSPQVLKKHERALRPMRELGKMGPEFKESKDGSNYVLNLDLQGMDKDRVEVSVSGKLVSVRGAVKDEESWRTQDGGTSRSVSSSAVTRSYIAPGPVLGAKAVTKWEDGKLIITLPKAPLGTICDEPMEGIEAEEEGGLMPLSGEGSAHTLLDAWNDMEQEMETMLRPFGGELSSVAHHAKLTPEERKDLEEHHAKEEEAKERLRQAYEERRAKEEEVRTKRVMLARRRNMFTELERDGDDLKLSVLVPEGTDPKMCSMAVEEDRFGRQFLLVDLKDLHGKIVKERRLPLSDEIDPNAISAKFDDKEGKLNIVLMQRKPKQISIDIMKD